MTLLGIVFVTSKLAVGAGYPVRAVGSHYPQPEPVGAGLYPGNGQGPGLICLWFSCCWGVVWCGAWLTVPYLSPSQMPGKLVAA